MNDRVAAAEAGLRFFGRVTASISHEISNVLATIYENAGLLEDLLLSAERGRPLDPLRLKDLASRMQTQVKRGRSIVENMNRFAHSVDEPRRVVDLSELLRLSASLAQRLASMQGVVLETDAAAKPVRVRTDPFLLQNLIWLCLDFIMAGEPSPNHIRLVPEMRGNEACIHFTGAEHRPPESVFPTQSLEILCKSVGARLTQTGGGILLGIPEDAGKGGDLPPGHEDEKDP